MPRALFLSAAGAAFALVAAMPLATQAAEFSGHAGPTINDSIGGVCTGGARSFNSPNPGHVGAITCGSALGVTSAAATSSFGHVGASASAATLTSATLPAITRADAHFRDDIFFTSTDPNATVADVSANVVLDGILNAAGVPNFSGADAELDGILRIATTFFEFSYRVFSDGTFQASNPLQQTGGVIGPGGFNASLATPMVLIELNKPVLFEFDLLANAESGGPGASATADFGGSFKFPTGTDAFNLADGVTANAGDWLVNDRFHDPLATPAGGVPEPTSWALMIAGFGLAGAALRRRPAAA